MEWYRATQQFSAELSTGAQRVVAIGEVLDGGHELVKLDRDAAAAAADAGIDRQPLFALVATEPDPPKAKVLRAKAAG